jgi:hypothetical protein
MIDYFPATAAAFQSPSPLSDRLIALLDIAQDVAPAKSPAPTDPIAWNHSLLGQLIDGLEMDLEQGCHFGRGHYLFHPFLSPSNFGVYLLSSASTSRAMGSTVGCFST